MRRFILLLLNEFKLSRTAPVVHLIAILQPTLMYLLMATIMVVPTFEMKVVESDTQLGRDFLNAMEEVGSPIGPDYIQPILVESADPGHRQVIKLIDLEGKPTALQQFGMIDSNLVKNLRNRLTAAALVLWNHDLGSRGILIQEHPWLPVDIPYTVYFGMAMIPLAAYLAAAMIGGYLMAGEFENGTILVYRLSPTHFLLPLGAKLTRLIITGLAAAAILYLSLGIITGVWASAVLPVFLILLPLTVIAACIGLTAGMLTQSALPSFLAALASAFAFWLIGSGFGLAAGFSTTFERISRLIPNTPVVEMLFPYFYFGRQVSAHPLGACLQLVGYSLALIVITGLVYRLRVLSKKR
ncbi:MAG: ABC transporter permease [Anaerolineales bacterium]|nr:ABC transporter permease [Anaerolineales bacterium]